MEQSFSLEMELPPSRSEFPSWSDSESETDASSCNLRPVKLDRMRNMASDWKKLTQSCTMVGWLDVSQIQYFLKAEQTLARNNS